MAGEKIVQMMMSMKTAESDLADVVYGRVVSVEPLSIQISNQTQPLPASFFIVGQLCREFEVNGQLMWRGLKKDDNVIMLRISKGQKFFVLEREGDLNDTEL